MRSPRVHRYRDPAALRISAYARNFLERQINKTRGDLERSERSLVAYAQAQGIINTGGGGRGKPAGDTNSLQGESLVKLNEALAEATARRVRRKARIDRRLQAGRGATSTQSTAALQTQLAQLQADYQQKRTFMKPDHPEMVSLRSQIDELQRQIGKERRRSRRATPTACLPTIGQRSRRRMR